MATLETNSKMLNVADPQKAMFREVTPEDLAWLHEQVPYVHVVHEYEEYPIKALKSDEDCNDFKRGYPFVIPFENQWQFEYYPRYETRCTHATLTGCSVLNKQDGLVDLKNNASGLQDRFNTVMQMVNFCKLQGWSRIHISEGTDFMKWAVWAYCDYLELPVTGYDPSDYDQMRQKNVASVMASASAAFIKPLAPSFVQGGVGAVDVDDVEL